MKTKNKTPDSATALRLLIANNLSRDTQSSQCIMAIRKDLDELNRLKLDILSYKSQLEILQNQIATLKNEIFALQTAEVDIKENLSDSPTSKTRKSVKTSKE